MEKVSIGAGNAYAQEFKKFTESKLFERLKEKYRIKPYHEQNAQLRKVVLISSYLFNILSIATGFYFAYSLLNSFSHVLIAIVLSVALLICLESFKRLILPAIFKTYYQFNSISYILCLVALCLVALSGFMSFRGGDTAVHELSKMNKTDTIRNTELSIMIADRIQQQKQLSKVKYKGTVTRTAQKAINALQTEINQLRGQELDELNDLRERETAETAKIWFNGLVLSLFALIFDFSLIFCLWYLEHYDYHSIAEFSSLDDGDTADTRQDDKMSGVGVNSLENNEVKQIAETAKKNCLNCSAVFDVTAPNKKFCSTKCRVNYWEKKNKKVLSVPTV